MKITAALLEEKGACEDDIENFEEQWPEGCRVTRKNCRIAFKEMDLSLDWAVEKLLKTKARNEYSRRHEDMQKACVKAAAGCKCYGGEIELFYLAARG